MSKTPKTLGIPVTQMQTLAASDGELHLGVPDGRGSSHSLNSASSRQVGKVASWAVSFERLLEDPAGVSYFTDFLKSEVSAENILFWQACEKFRKIAANQKEQLMREARSIYDDYLSNNAFYAINIDDTARTEEKDLEDPKPDMFHKAQQQIFKLMKFDSYARFVRSPLYQSCMLADVECRPLPDPKNLSSVKVTPESSISESKKQQQKKKVKLRKSLPFDVEDGTDLKKGTPDSKAGWDKRLEKRGSWGVERSEHGVNVSRNESQCSIKSTGSAELAGSYSKVENGSSCTREAARGERYCCVYLPDGTASLAPARPGLLIREMLTGLCEKRGFSLSDIVIYLHGKDKQPLSLEQDSSVLRDQQVSLELRVKFTLEVVFTKKTMGIMVKSSKTLQDALSSVLEKHNLRPQDVVVTMNEKKEPLNLTMNVFRLSGKKLLLDRVNGSDQSSAPIPRVQSPPLQQRPAGTVEEERPSSPPYTVKTSCRIKNSAVQRTDMDGLIDLLSRVSCQVDDQRGLLTKEHLVIPEFLQLRKEDGAGGSREENPLGNHGPPEEPAAVTAVPQPLPGSKSRLQSEQSPHTSSDARPGCPPPRETAV